MAGWLRLADGRPPARRFCSQDVVAGDGTTSVTVLAGALLKASLLLLEQVCHACVHARCTHWRPKGGRRCWMRVAGAPLEAVPDLSSGAGKRPRCAGCVCSIHCALRSADGGWLAGSPFSLPVHHHTCRACTPQSLAMPSARRAARRWRQARGGGHGWPGGCCRCCCRCHCSSGCGRRLCCSQLESSCSRHESTELALQVWPAAGGQHPCPRSPGLANRPYIAGSDGQRGDPCQHRGP